jgi:acyl-CoA reductase-like NAD-dependent aldehyde dehydrogenase
MSLIENHENIDARFHAVQIAGGITRNDFLLHPAVDGVPFGGVGGSGMGAYHEKARLMPAVDSIVRKQATRVRKRINRFQSRRSD